MSGNDICIFTDLDVEICTCRKHSTTKPKVPADPGIFGGIPDDVYHGDKNSLSSSGARKLLRCPALFKWERDHGAEHADHFDFGHAAHKYVLGEGAEISVIFAENWRTNKAKELKKAAYKAGKVPLLAQEDDAARAMARAVHAHPVAAALLASGVAEQSIYWTDPVAWIRLRARPDWITEYEGRVTLVDYKTSQNADPRGFARSAADYGYHQQAAWYLAGARDQEIAYDPRFIFIVQEKVRPYLVSVHEYTAEDLEIGDRRNREAIDLYAACMATDTWPAYGDHIHTLRLPRWARTYEGA